MWVWRLGWVVTNKAIPCSTVGWEERGSCHKDISHSVFCHILSIGRMERTYFSLFRSSHSQCRLTHPMDPCWWAYDGFSTIWHYLTFQLRYIGLQGHLHSRLSPHLHLVLHVGGRGAWPSVPEKLFNLVNLSWAVMTHYPQSVFPPPPPMGCGAAEGLAWALFYCYQPSCVVSWFWSFFVS